jgi:uncharacterized C2H2 Zn-finger protein
MREKDLKNLLRCPICGKRFVRARDKITGKKSKYLYKPNCKHLKNIIISVG